MGTPHGTHESASIPATGAKHGDRMAWYPGSPSRPKSRTLARPKRNETAGPARKVRYASEERFRKLTMRAQTNGAIPAFAGRRPGIRPVRELPCLALAPARAAEDGNRPDALFPGSSSRGSAVTARRDLFDPKSRTRIAIAAAWATRLHVEAGTDPIHSNQWAITRLDSYRNAGLTNSVSWAGRGRDLPAAATRRARTNGVAFGHAGTGTGADTRTGGKYPEANRIRFVLSARTGQRPAPVRMRHPRQSRGRTQARKRAVSSRETTWSLR